MISYGRPKKSPFFVYGYTYLYCEKNVNLFCGVTRHNEIRKMKTHE
jgi:hypothetical protein